MQNNRMRLNNEAKDMIPEPEIGVGTERQGEGRPRYLSSRETRASDIYNVRKFGEDSSL